MFYYNLKSLVQSAAEGITTLLATLHSISMFILTRPVIHDFLIINTLTGTESHALYCQSKQYYPFRKAICRNPHNSSNSDSRFAI